MFDLESRIANWSKRLRQRGTLRDNDIEELEQHVRDATAERIAAGLTEEEAFWVAIGRVGEARDLAAEFGKINSGLVWAQRVFWMLAGILLFDVCRWMIAAVATLGLTLTARVGGDAVAMVWIAAGLTLAGWSAVLLFLYRSRVSHDALHPLNRLLAHAGGFKIGVCIALAMLAAGAIRMGSTWYGARHMSIADFGEAFSILSIVNLALTALIPVTGLLVMLGIRRRLSAGALT